VNFKKLWEDNVEYGSKEFYEEIEAQVKKVWTSCYHYERSQWELHKQNVMNEIARILAFRAMESLGMSPRED
jgi:hypothetical protein